MSILDRITDDLNTKMNSAEHINQIKQIESTITDLQSTIGMNGMKIESQQSKLDSLVTVDEVREAIKELRNDFSKNIKELKENVTVLDKNKANVESTVEALSLKADADLVEKVLQSKALKEEVSMIKDEIKELTDNRVERDNYDSYIKKVKNNLEDINKELSLKSNIKDVCKLMDLKANLK